MKAFWAGFVAIILLGAKLLPAATDCFAYQSQWGAYGFTGDQIHDLSALTVAGSQVYVGQGYEIKVYDTNGNHQFSWGSSGSGNGQFNSLQGLATDGSHIYVSDTNNHRIQKFGLDGAFVATWGSQGNAQGQFVSPTALAVDATRVYVIDTYNYRVQSFDKVGGFLAAWGSFGTGPEQFGHPFGIAADGTHVYVTDFNDKDIKKFTPSGTMVTRWILKDRWPNFYTPVPLVLINGLLYTADSQFGTILAIRTDGAPVGLFGSYGSGPGQFDQTAFLAASGSELLLAERSGWQVQKWTAAACGLFPGELSEEAKLAGKRRALAYEPIDGPRRFCFRFITPVKFGRIRVYNAVGQLVATDSFSQRSDHCLDAEGLARGVYFFKLNYEDDPPLNYPVDSIKSALTR